MDCRRLCSKANRLSLSQSEEGDSIPETKIQNYNIKNMINQLNNSTNFSYNQTEELSNKADSIQFNNNINSNPINKMTTEKTPYWTS